MRVSVVRSSRWLLLATASIAWPAPLNSAPQAPAAPARAPDRFIYVSAGEVPSECYHDLGGVTFTEPYTDAAMDGDGVQMAAKLRALAIAKYPDRADAVINVQMEQNSVGTIVTVNGEVVELHQGHTVECAMRKTPGVLDRTLAVAAGGMLGAAAGALIPGAGTVGIMGGAAAGVATVGTTMAVKQHQETVREREQLKRELTAQQNEIAHLLAKRSSLQKCVDNEIPQANCKVDDPIAAAGDSSKPADDPSYETEQPQFELEKQIQEQQGYIKKLRDQVFELQEQMGGYSANTSP